MGSIHYFEIFRLTASPPIFGNFSSSPPSLRLPTRNTPISRSHTNFRLDWETCDDMLMIPLSQRYSRPLVFMIINVTTIQLWIFCTSAGWRPVFLKSFSYLSI